MASSFVLPSGVQHDSTPPPGFTVHLDEPYSHETTHDELDSIPKDATWVMLGAKRNSGEANVHLWAVGKREEVLLFTEQEKPHEDNGVWWYRAKKDATRGRSVGFASMQKISQNNSDLCDDEGQDRLSWHVPDPSWEWPSQLGGWRVGMSYRGDGKNSTWRKVIYYWTDGVVLPATMPERKFLFSSESVNEGHPDKICDQVSDAILDTCLTTDPKSKVACETCAKDNMIMVAGEIAKLDYEKVVREAIKGIGYDAYVDDLSSVDFKGLSHKTCEVLVRINKQSPDIADGVHVGKEEMDVSAGDQGIMFGYATDETEDSMPLTHSMAACLGKTLTEVRKSGECWWLRPDGKTQVTIEYLQKTDGSVEPISIHTVVISTQHAEPSNATRTKEVEGYTGAEETAPSMEEMNKLIIEKVVKRTLSEIILKNGKPALTLYGDHTHNYINPSGKFIIGGPQGDAGLTGRKIIIDTYGGWGAHGGGAFSGKDPTKVDRSAAYICRQMAKSLVKSGLVKRCLVQLSYAIGVAKPLSLFVETYGSEICKLDADDITNVLKVEFDCRPGALAISLALREPKYQVTAAYCHFGRTPYTKDGIKYFEWENSKDVSKYGSMDSAQVTAALKASNYLQKWVD